MNTRFEQKLAVTLILILGIILLGVIYFFSSTKGTIISPKAVQKSASVTPTPTPTPTPNVAQAPISSYYYPMSDYASRIKYRWFGKYVNAADTVPYCGAAFTGYHDADDLEATPGEQNIAVPVLAIASGSVRQVGYVSGYGGLLVLSTNIRGADYTVYYGHINLASTILVAGSTVQAGQKLAELGAACSSQTAGERKHLHFAIHRGTAVDVRGYVPDLSTLANWVNPKDLLSALGAK